jgi:hypothetical protein
MINVRWPDKFRNKSTKFKLDTGRIAGINHILLNDNRWTKSSQVIKEQKLKLKIRDDYRSLLKLDLCSRNNIMVESILDE